MVRASLGGAAMHAEPVQDAKYGEPVGSIKPSDSQIIGLTVFTAKSGALFRPGVSGALLDSAIGRSHSEALSAVVASANFEAKMNLLLHPWYLLLVLLSECVRQQQEKVIEFQRAQIEILMKELGPQRIRLSDDQRRRLAVKGKVLGRKKLQELTTIVQADTILRWHRQLVVQNGYTGPRGKTMGRPRTDRVIVDLSLHMASENVSWGYKRIQSALDNVGHHICSSTVANILKTHGVEPAPERRRQLSWGVFLKAPWDGRQARMRRDCRPPGLDGGNSHLGSLSRGRLLIRSSSRSWQVSRSAVRFPQEHQTECRARLCLGPLSSSL